ncbi:peptidoglycan-binding protein [Curtobacterium sp. 9128]|uniref:peptidoglycan-binding domain-containing protein n=1 Tax=Curtobacterium sp. 9128 TaxID=1793722 RepID=UPI0016434160|nr:peptidoglycan-binding domain-containing protein [Curtobacterium sp. 9128]
MITRKVRNRLVAAAAAGALTLGGVLLGASPASALSNCTGTTFGWGWNTTNHGCIEDIQGMLNNVDDQDGGRTIAIDGVWGTNTVWAVENFQNYDHVSSDGVVGPRTWRDLCNDAGPTGWAVDAGCRF